MRTRRSFLGAAAALAASTLPQIGRAQTPQSDGEWTFTDDRGVTVTLPERPERIVADLSAAAPLWDFGIRPLAVSGWTVTTEAAWGNVDRSIQVINASADLPEPDNEKLLELQPDLFVSITWSKGDPDDVWSFSDPESRMVTEQIVPVVAIAATGRADENMHRFEELAGLIGADLETDELVQARERFDASVSAFQEISQQKSDLTSMFAYAVPADAQWYFANPLDWADLAWYQALGMQVLEPGIAPGDYWLGVSYEEVGNYPCDVLFMSSRDGTYPLADLKTHNTFGLHPAVANDQLGAWNQDFIMSYQGLADALDNMTTVLTSAEKIT